MKRTTPKRWDIQLTTALIALAILLTACSPTASPTDELVPPTPSPTPNQTLVLPLSVYILEGSEAAPSSTQTVDDLRRVYEGVNEIWSRADIRVELWNIQRLTIPDDTMAAINEGDLTAFLQALTADVVVPYPSLINAFYAPEIGGPNGLTPFGTTLFFVADEPTIPHARVAAHEIGHILGLYHTWQDQDRLLYPGADGTELNEEEIFVARYAARGLIEEQR